MIKPISEENIFAVLVVFLIFLVVNFDPNMATVFSLMIIADILIFTTIIKKLKVDYPFERTTKNRFTSLIESLIIFAGFIFLQTIVLRILTPTIQSTSQSLQSLLSLYATTTPALQGNMIFTFIAYGLIVPFVETRFFFGRLYELLADKFNKAGTLKNKMTWILALFIGSIFAIYHLTARRCGAAGACQNALLFVTFLFGMISTLMVAHYKETKQAVLVHVFANSMSILYAYGGLSIIGLVP